ncbi:HlyD family efflux transporter periplasmic adaptor subunit [Guyparkeria sp. 1SP6A2]|nr:HlyD family efflux transporter periplasmic adaptor subunit [Guyparkeria sp. 1SP6A2]
MRKKPTVTARGLTAPFALATLLAAGLAGSAWAAEVQGQLTFAERLSLSTPVAGVIDALPVRAGERVEAGALLLSLDRTPFDQRRRMAAAGLEGLRLSADEAARDAERVQALYDRTVGSESERALAVIAREKAQGRHERARAETALRAWEREHAQLHAPFAARVLAVNAAAGEVVSPRLTPPTLIEIARADRLLASALIDADRLGDIELGDPVVVIRDEERRDGVVEVIRVQDGEDGRVRYRLGVLLETEGLDWRAGQSVSIEWPDD